MVEKEEWRMIPDYGTKYEVSNFGRVRSWTTRFGRLLKTPRILKFETTAKGYLKVGLSLKGKYKRRRVHRLVLSAFKGPCPVGHQASHIDGNSVNNSIDNLKWVLPVENIYEKWRHGTMANGERIPCSKLTAKQIVLIRKMYNAGISAADISELFNVTDVNISCIVRKKTWKHVLVD